MRLPTNSHPRPNTTRPQRDLVIASLARGVTTDIRSNGGQR